MTNDYNKAVRAYSLGMFFRSVDDLLAEIGAQHHGDSGGLRGLLADCRASFVRSLPSDIAVEVACYFDGRVAAILTIYNDGPPARPANP